MSEQKTINRALLVETLEKYGADCARWPDNTRAGLEALIAEDPLAKSAMDEFAAFDQLLTNVGDRAGEQSIARHDALAEKIMRSVAAEATQLDNSDTVVPFEPARRRVQQTKRTKSVWPNVAAAGALAASLVLGITIGITGVANSTLAPVSEVLGLGDIATETVALSDPIFDAVDDNSFDEDVL